MTLRWRFFQMAREEPRVNSGTVPNFRTRTGQKRRAQTRRRIIAAAFEVFDAKDMGSITIEHVREAAGLSRGTFYYYFNTLDAMLGELARDITLQINREQDEYFSEEQDAVLKLFYTMTYFLARATSDTACCEILLRVMPVAGSPTRAMRNHAIAWFIDARKLGLIDIDHFEIALEAGYGIGSSILRRAMVQGTSHEEIAFAIFMFLRAIGIPTETANAFSKLPPPKLPKLPLREAAIESGFHEAANHES